MLDEDGHPERPAFMKLPPEVQEAERPMACTPTREAARARDGPTRDWVSLRNVSAVSRSLAAPTTLADNTAVSRSLAEARLDLVKPEPFAAAPGLSNMSAVSHNLANVGALPQCNQRHARCVAPVAVAEESKDIPEAVAVQHSLLEASQRPFRFASGEQQPPKARGRRTQRAATDADAARKLELRRTKNREAAERMRRRRREETQSLERTVKELTARVDELAAKLAASEAENQQLRGLKQLVIAVARPQPDAASASNLLAEHVSSLVTPQLANDNDNAADLPVAV